MERKVAQFIASEGLIEPEDKVLVALSGGADSVALLRVLLALGYRCEAAHCNFTLRGMESDRDEAFVRELCHTLHVPLHVARFDTCKEAETRHVSIEMAARYLRYGWFERLRQEINAAVVAVAHHRDDSVETLLLNLIRGTGIGGLCGIRARNGAVVRPLLCTDRKEILAYLDSLDQPYVTDSTNLQATYTRNKIRLRLLPLMEEINPSVRDALIKTAARLADVALVYHHGMAEARGRVQCAEGIDLTALQQAPAPAALLFELLHPLGFNAAQIENIHRSLTGQPGKVFLSDSWQVVKDRDRLLVTPRPRQTSHKTVITENGETLDGDNRSVITANGMTVAADTDRPLLHVQTFAYTPGFTIPRTKETACFDADKLQEPLILRPWRHGDSFIPFGMRGRKLVSDYLTDRKFSLLQKERQWVLCSGDAICWLVGERSDDRFKVTDHTKRVTVATLLPPDAVR
ncbi:MAG: tRNA lysidine(34) synthetase TilS [Prevotellaceae bacterium]|nr:tRNA lysidine(34) synthetase TilS [Prevotellaceae bacterium]